MLNDYFLPEIIGFNYDYSNIRPSAEKPMRNGKVCPKYRTEPFEKPELTDRLLQLAGVKGYD